jgi:hypothetical protein
VDVDGNHRERVLFHDYFSLVRRIYRGICDTAVFCEIN